MPRPCTESLIALVPFLFAAPNQIVCTGTLDAWDVEDALRSTLDAAADRGMVTLTLKYDTFPFPLPFPLAFPLAFPHLAARLTRCPAPLCVCRDANITSLQVPFLDAKGFPATMSPMVSLRLDNTIIRSNHVRRG